MIFRARYSLLPTAAPVTAAFAALAIPAAAHAAVPEPVKAMIEAAIATGDPAKVDTVTELATSTNPEDAAEIQAMARQFRDEQIRLAAEQEALKRERLGSAGLFEIWTGKGEVGASRSTGNSHETGLTGGLTLERKGLQWRHKLIAAADYHRTDGKTTTEQFLLSYEPNYRLNHRSFAYGLTQIERDRIQGFSSRISLSAGLGYQIFDRENMHLSMKAGPAWRGTNQIPSGRESELGALAALDFDVLVAKNLKLTQVASTYGQSGNSTLNSTTGLEAKINGHLSARISYKVEHDTDPPDDAIKTDTLSRFTLIYDF